MLSWEYSHQRSSEPNIPLHSHLGDRLFRMARRASYPSEIRFSLLVLGRFQT